KAFTPHPAICTDAGCAYAYPTYKSCFNGRPDKAFTPHPAICTDAGCAYASPTYKSCFNRRPDKAFTPHPAIVHWCRMLTSTPP
ncbi:MULTISPECIES: hypothetical protein, partial [unclassified Escherichia]|uniref:hypothetical protein n=1 Tax=unclassified Escherichia TaxID=2608889 RepID=UPI001EEFD90B